jgi:hypothetical protein
MRETELFGRHTEALAVDELQASPETEWHRHVLLLSATARVRALGTFAIEHGGQRRIEASGRIRRTVSARALTWPRMGFARRN